MIVAGVSNAGNAADRPNIVLIFMDNFGYGELGVYGWGITRGAPTPRIDRLAEEGIRLTNFNVEAQCTPSRSALMTGRYAVSSGSCRGVLQYALTSSIDCSSFVTRLYL